MTLPPPLWVATQPALDALCAALATEPAVGVDTESNSLYVYRERVCVIQFSTPTHDYILDALALPDLQPLAPFFANPVQQKIFHAAEYDVLCMRRDYGFRFANLFDTMVAARTLGCAHIGLAALLEQHFGVQMNKKYQRANWGQRPLTPALLDYARLDTHYLIRLRDQLRQQLRTKQREEEANEEFVRLEQVEAHTSHPPNFWRINGARDLTPRQAAVLREVFNYREQQAAKLDYPPFKVMNDQTLLALAEQCPKALEDLPHLPGMTPGQIQRHGGGLLQAIKQGLASAPVYPPPFERETDEVRERYDRLHEWRKHRARARGVESDVIVPRDALWELARRVPRTPADLERMQHLGPWRRQTYGAEILQVLNPGSKP